MTTSKQIEKEMQFFHQAAVQMFKEDGAHGTMLFPFRDGKPMAILGVPDMQLNVPEAAELDAAQIKVTTLPEAPDAFILICEAWMVLAATSGNGRPASQHAERQSALLISGATQAGFRSTGAVVFDKDRNIIAYLSGDTPQMVLIQNALDAIARPLFDPDIAKWRQLLDERKPGWEEQQQVQPLTPPRMDNG